MESKLDTNQKITESCTRMEVHFDQMMIISINMFQPQVQIKFKNSINFRKLSSMAIR